MAAALPRVPLTARPSHTTAANEEGRGTPSPPPTLRGTTTYLKSNRGSYSARRPDIAEDTLSWQRSHPLEGDGLLAGLYQYLYKKDKNFQSAKVHIPDTVVYEHNFPRGWYSYDSKAQEMLKRVGKDLDTSTIYQRFVKCPGRSDSPDTIDICAQFIHTSSIDEASSSQIEPATTVEFMTPNDLFHFLNERKQRPDGILQKFVLPKSKFNTQIQAVWSPKVCIVQRRENVAALNDRYISTFERCVTFDGPTHYTEEGFCAPKSKDQIKRICESIVKHVFQTEHKTITRMVLYFKVDRNDNVWLLWGSSLRMMGSKHGHTPRVPLNLSPAFAAPTINEATAKRSREWAKVLEESDQKQFTLSHDPMFARTVSPRAPKGKSPQKSRTVPATSSRAAAAPPRNEDSEAKCLGPPLWEVEAEREFGENPRMMRRYTALCSDLSSIQASFEDLMYAAYSQKLRTTGHTHSPRERPPLVFPLPEPLEKLSTGELTTLTEQLKMNVRDETVEDSRPNSSGGMGSSVFTQFGGSNSGLVVEVNTLRVPLTQANLHVADLVQQLKQQRVDDLRRRSHDIINSPPTPDSHGMRTPGGEEGVREEMEASYAQMDMATPPAVDEAVAAEVEVEAEADAEQYAE